MKKRKDGRYAIQVYLGTDESGKRIVRSVYGRTQVEARSAAEALKASIGKGLDIQHDRDTFATWRERWFSTKQLEIGQSQIRNYQATFKYLKPLDNMKPCDIRPQHIQAIINALASNNPHTGKPSSKKTLTDIRNTVSQIFAYLALNRVLEFNPSVSVIIPKTAPQAARRALTASEQELIRTTPHKLRIAGMIMLYAGLRRGELIALRWSDIDLSAGTININKSADLKNSSQPIKDTKTNAGTRIVYIPQILIDYLSDQQPTSDLVCPTVNGQMYTASAWKAAWKSYLLALDLASGQHDGKQSVFDPKRKGIAIESFTPHNLRHTAATIMIESGMDPATVQRQLGHADARTTLAIYTHISDRHRQQEMQKFNLFLSNSCQNSCQKTQKTIDI